MGTASSRRLACRRSAPRSTASSRLRARGGCTSPTGSRSHRAARCSPTTCARGTDALASHLLLRDRQHGDQPERTLDLHARRRGNEGRRVAYHRGRRRRPLRPVDRGTDRCPQHDHGPKDGQYLYLGGVDYPYLEVASTATNRVVRKIGPLNGPGVRPFTINGSQTLAFTTARSFLGFQVSSISTGKVLYTVPLPGFSFDPAKFGRTPDHGISLSPDERRLYLIDTPNGYVHVFDVQGLPGSRPSLARQHQARAPTPERRLAPDQPQRALPLRRAVRRRDRHQHAQGRRLPPSHRSDRRLPRDRLAARTTGSDDESIRHRVRSPPAGLTASRPAGSGRPQLQTSRDDPPG